ncbi:MAG: hypothetical protein AAF985_20375, partial [Bacteroidota bacterium]
LMYESENFITYWYGEGRRIGQSVVQMAELDHDYVQNILEHRMNNKIEIIVYKDLTDIKQSNIGSEEAFINTGGKTKIVGNKVYVYFDGNHKNLRRSVREGIATVYMNAMMFGSNLQEIVQNAVMLNLPAWFKDGLISYVGEEWSAELDNQLRDIILSEDFKDFDRLTDDYPILAGHSMWYYISQNYGKSTVSNLLYLTRINRSIESGYLYVLGTPYKKTTENWLQYFQQRYKTEIEGMDKLRKKGVKIKNRRKARITQVKISPNGKKIAYVLNEIGKIKLYLQDIRTGDRKMILKYGSRNAFQATDYNYPLIAWNPNNLELGVIYEKRDVVKSLLYDLASGKGVKDVLPNQFQRVYSLDYVNPSKMLFSAAVRGISDIYTYIPVTRQFQAITNDFWDDLDASFVKIDGRKGILFASNRQDSMLMTQKLDSILPINNFDIFYYDLETKSKELVRVTYTPFADERQPIGIDSTWFVYTSDQSGVVNRQMAYLEEYLAFYEQVIRLTDGSEVILHQDSSLSLLDSTLIDSIALRPVYKKRAIKHNVTNYPRNIREHHVSLRRDKLVELIDKDGEQFLYVQKIDTAKVQVAQATRFREQSVLVRDALEETIKIDPPASVPDEPDRGEPFFISPHDDLPTEPDTIPEKIAPKEEVEKVDVDNYLFQSEFDDEEIPARIVDNPEPDVQESEQIIEPTNRPIPSFRAEETVQQVHKFRPARIVPYRLKFKTDYVTTQLDNSLLFGGLNTYAGFRQDNSFPPPGILLKANFKDLFEDYEVEGGIRVPTTFNGAEYFLLFDNKKKRLDKRFAVYRWARKTNDLVFSGNPLFTPKSKRTAFLTQLQLRYPLDIFRSIRATTTLRLDKRTQLATDVNTLDTPTEKQQRLGVQLEYVFDNTLDVDLNIKHGTRYKVWVEVLKRFEIDFIDGFTFDLSEGFMTVLGIDARHYQRLDKHSVLAGRFAASTSLGSERILFFLGGVDNWLFPQFNDEIPIPAEEGLAYQTFANNLRGFKTNVRNGTSYALVNLELRVPIFKYFSRRVRSSFFRNFQIVGFFDFGTAWQGLSPYSDDNPLNTTTITNSNVRVDINYFRDPIVAGYGAGIRSVLFGYFLRLDYAWGIETRVVQDPILYFSMGVDF